MNTSRRRAVRLAPRQNWGMPGSKSSPASTITDSFSLLRGGGTRGATRRKTQEGRSAAHDSGRPSENEVVVRFDWDSKEAFQGFLPCFRGHGDQASGTMVRADFTRGDQVASFPASRGKGDS